MTAGKLLGVAAKIKVPISLAALVVIVVLCIVQLLPADKLGGEDTRKLLTIVLVGLLVLATLALIGALIQGRQRPMSSIDVTTRGKQSPGIVGRDYTVGAGSPKHDDSGVGSQTSLKVAPGSRITTEGDQSPGVVGRDFSVEAEKKR